ncbi:MAG: hypothetical protein O3A01_07560, partial [bacterium]|nr:hypothetical protein [bacterium]
EDIPVQIMRQRRAASDDVDRLFKSLDLPDSRDFQTQQTVISELDVLEARVYDESTWFHTEMAKLIHVGGNVSPENQLNTFLGILSVITHLGQLRLQQFNLLKRVNGDQNGEFDMAVQHIEKLVAQAGRIYQQLTQGEQTLKDGQHSVAHQLKLEGLMRVLSKYPSLTQYFLNPKPDFGVMRDVDVEILHPFGPNGTSTAISNLSVATSRAETPQPVRRRLEEDFARAGDALPSSSSSSLISSPSQSASPLPPFLASPLVRSEPVLDSVAPSTLTEKLQAISNALEVLSQDSELDFEIQKYKEKICLYKYLQALEDKADMNGFSDIQDPHERVRQVLDSLVPPTSLGGDVAYSTLDLELLQLIYHYVLNESNEHRFVFDAAAGMPDNVRRWALRYDQISQVVLTDKGDSLLDKLLSVIQANGSESTPLMAVERLFLLHQIKSGVLSAAPDEALGKWVNHVLMQQVRHMPTVLHTDELHPVLWTRLQEIVRDTFTIDADADTLLGRTTPVNEFMLMRARATVNDTKNTLQLTEAQIGAYNRWYRDYVMMHELCRNLKDCKDQGALDTFMALSQIKTLRRFAPENCGVMLDLRARLRWLGAQDLGINVADYLQNSDDIADHNWVRDDIEQNGYNPEQFAHNFYFRAPMINQIHAATILPPTQAKITPPWQLELPEIFVF